MTPLQKRILLLLSILVGLTRFLAVARSLNDWDEALFSMGVDEYDVNLHHPHPPGYPLFVAAAKAIHLLGLSEFRSVQVVVLIGAFFLFPAAVLFARECGFPFVTAVCGAVLFVFLPNVWIYSGTAFSDVPATAIGLTACWLLLRGRRDSRAYLLGAIVLGIAAGFRVPNLIIGALPALIATFHRLRARDFRNVILAAILGGAIAGGSYLGAALASGTIEQYRFMVRMQSEYVRAVDSWRNPGRGPLSEVAKLFFIWPIDQRQQMTWLTGIALIGIVAAVVRRRWALLLPLAIFGPFMILAWLNLDIAAAGRYAIAYLLVHGLYAAHALGEIARRPAVQATLTAMIVIVFSVWTWPALRQQRTTDAPVAGAMNWVLRSVPKHGTVYVQGVLGPHAMYLLRERNPIFYEESREITDIGPDTWVIEPRIMEGGHNFVWPRNAIWKILRRRNFEVSVLRLVSMIDFGDGFYQQEAAGQETFRWMGRTARASLPAVPKNGTLAMRIYVPIDTIQPPPTITVRYNGAVLDQFVGTKAIVEKLWNIPSRKDQANELVIETSDVVVPGNGDERQLGLRIDSMSWTPQL